MKQLALITFVAWLFVLLGPFGTQLEFWSWQVGLGITGFGGLICAIVPWRMSWKRANRWALMGALPLLPLLGFIALLITAPPQNDVATDPINPPSLLWAQTLRSAEDNSITQPPLQAFPGNPSAYFSDASFTAIQEAAVAVAKELGWEYRRTTDGIEAVASTYWFGFKDDVALRITKTNEGQRVDMRSSSRVGSRDFGTNSARISHFLTLLQEKLNPAK